MPEPSHLGVIRHAEAESSGLTRHELARSVARGGLQRLDRGVYAPADLIEPEMDLAIVCARLPRGVVCLLSAMRLHDLTTQNPSVVWLAVPRGAWHPQGLSVPVRLVTMHASSIELGLQTRTIAGRAVRLHDLERTLVDGFKFRNAIGLDVAIESLKQAWQQRRVDLDKLMVYAKRLRMAQVMRPYLEAMA